MVGQHGKHSDDDDNFKRYHGTRRNATTNISRQRTWSDEHPSSSSRIGRVNRSDPIYSRLSNFNKQTHKVDNRWKNTADNSHKDRNQQGDRGGPNKYKFTKKTREVYKTMEAVGRLKISKSYKIGDTNDSEKKSLLPSQSFCKLSNMEQNVFDLVVKFMQQYFTCFDKSRDELLAAYHPKALFSISFNLKSQATSRKTSRFGSYVRDSRNLVYVKSDERLEDMLHKNNLEIVAWLKKMPTTEHVSESLKLDSSFFQPHMLTFSISGVYVEKRSADEGASCYRSFQRTFVCVPVSSEQMIIVNEQCIISNLSEQQSKIYKEENLSSDSKKVMSPQSSTFQETPSEDPKLSMIKKFSNRTGLNEKWAKDCLEFSDWNYDVAEKNFFEHKSEIPAEAFIQNLMSTF